METRLLASEAIAEGTMLFRLEKPEGFSYIPGQNADFTLIDPKVIDSEGNKRTFSLVSTPSDEHLEIAVRIRDTAFKRTLQTLPIGSLLTIEGPYGDFMLHENVSRRAIFIAGGIGVTPFMSMIRNATEHSLPHQIVLFSSNRRPEDAPFLDKLKSLAVQNPNFTFVPISSQAATSSHPWAGERGHIDSAMFARYVIKEELPIYYVAGPAHMTVAIRSILNTDGVSNDDIRTEEFSGY
ncbi:MAG: putative Ferredoxin-NAD(+) reductase [Parcubacteria group bacterium]|nr:putative Ferredoxin-NAD(+) reductase [Parcubacteria group bacterium]